jgi:pimeloyl-ACP methyl ester carboxylesterase
MPPAELNDITLAYTLAGSGTPLVFIHEYGGDQRSWAPQIQHFAQQFLVLTYNHRGFAPSSVPKDACQYSQEILVADLAQLLTYLNLDFVHLAGCSMSANVARDFAIARPDMVRSLTLIGVGAGSQNRASSSNRRPRSPAGWRLRALGSCAETSRQYRPAVRFATKIRMGSANFYTMSESMTHKPAPTSRERY